MGIRIAALAAALFLAASAHAADAEHCKGKRAAERLKCYDDLHGYVPPPEPEVLVPTKAAAPPPNESLEKRWDLGSEKHALFVPDTYRPMYVLFANWTDRTNPQPTSPSAGHTVTTPFVLRPLEAKYQISFKSKFAEFWGVSMWGAYTQSSRWQVYNSADSRPFRETNYEPEILFTKPLTIPFWDGHIRMASIAFNHQSNGRALPLSRSWNRVIGSVVYEKGEWTVEARSWWRVPEGAASDDNPDISDFAGRGEIRVARRFGNHVLSMLARHSLRFGSRSHGSAQFDYVFPVPFLKPLHGQLQVFTGYGESLIDYNVRQTRVGLGVTIAGWH